MKTAIRYIFLLIFPLYLLGCSDNESQPKTGVIAAYDPNKPTSFSSPKSDIEKATQAIKDFQFGLEKAESSVNDGDVKKAAESLVLLRGAFHGVIHPFALQTKGEAFTNQLHEQFIELEESIANNDINNTTRLLKVNRENIHNLSETIINK